ncbi:hypothetical protein FD514_11095 [Cutibacterium acnes]|nr:hypothetical protein COH13_11480 [Cutibacterium acnes]REB15655.1 hypothetical protein COH12_09685 [Cutibacterium acnes]TLG15326.1 hypothetical protein FD521_10210 [Cutibacterium acnes]TLG15983.1 hypothetical protein FD522_01230 [Cutibacterium acnes]TLG20451.1 hypothetical protein FD514_11095 [Cutibacterium acnes]
MVNVLLSSDTGLVVRIVVVLLGNNPSDLLGYRQTVHSQPLTPAQTSNPILDRRPTPLVSTTTGDPPTCETFATNNLS